MKQKYNQMSIERVTDEIENICDEYGSFIDTDCVDEIIEKFFDSYDCSFTLQGMTEKEAQSFCGVLKGMIEEYISEVETV
jgi:hypothetical protein